MADKPFFSIIIPTYNPRNYISEMLNSISQNECANEIEVILSDDCSDKSFNDILEQFESLNIRLISNNQHYGFPRIGRQCGANIATGEWITFADQDDYYLYNALDAVKKCIIEDEVESVLFCAIHKENVETKERSYENPDRAWTHGKFIRKSFWDEYGLFYDELEQNEDSNIVTKIQCLLIRLNKPVNLFHSPVYVWVERPDSLGHSEKSGNVPDYIKAVVKVVFDHLCRYSYDERMKLIYKRSFILCLYRVFFYLQFIAYNFNREEIYDSIRLLQPMYDKFKSITGITNRMLINATYSDYAEYFNNIRNEVSDMQLVVEQITFRDWINTYFNSDNKEEYFTESIEDPH